MLIDNWTTAFLKLLEHLLLGNSKSNSHLQSHTKIASKKQLIKNQRCAKEVRLRFTSIIVTTYYYLLLIHTSSPFGLKSESGMVKGLVVANCQ